MAGKLSKDTLERMKALGPSAIRPEIKQFMQGEVVAGERPKKKRKKVQKFGTAEKMDRGIMLRKPLRDGK